MPALCASVPPRDRGRPAVLALSNGRRRLRRYVYVGNLGVLGDGRQAVERALAEAVKVFEGSTFWPAARR